MVEKQKYISASCIINKGVIYKNGRKVFEDEHEFNSLTVNLYQSLSLNYPKFYKMDSLSKLGWLAAEVLLKDSFDKSAYLPDDVGLVLTNANSSFDADLKYWQSAQDVASPSLFVYTLPNIVIGEICIRNGFKGEGAFYITPQFDSLFIQQQVNQLFANSTIKACICGWVDVVGNDYNASLFLVDTNEGGRLFAAEEIDNVINLPPPTQS